MHERRALYPLTTSKLYTPSLVPMLGAELKKAREAAGLTQEKLGFKAGVHRTYVSMLEREQASPTVDTLIRICKALKVRAWELIRRAEEGKR